MIEKTLVILAAGMGSRFGGLKQMEPVGPNGEFLIDYSIYSAKRYGFNKVVFIIKDEIYDDFKETIGKRLDGKIKVEYAFQRLSDIPSGFEIPEGRVKPWGTAHAIYSTKDVVTGNFGVITSDDFYGDQGFKDLAGNLNDEGHLIVGYKVGDTLSDNGSVKRAIITHENGIVTRLVESSCEREGDMVKCVPLDKSIEPFYCTPDTPCSMLLVGFNDSIYESIGNEMRSAFENNKDHLLDYEMLLPDIMDLDIKNGHTIKVVVTDSTWIGMTYKEDLETVKKYIQKEIENGVYPENLWEE